MGHLNSVKLVIGLLLFSVHTQISASQDCLTESQMLRGALETEQQTLAKLKSHFYRLGHLRTALIALQNRRTLYRGNLSGHHAMLEGAQPRSQAEQAYIRAQNECERYQIEITQLNGQIQKLEKKIGAWSKEEFWDALTFQQDHIAGLSALLNTKNAAYYSRPVFSEESISRTPRRRSSSDEE